jgi:hypothetical protein
MIQRIQSIWLFLAFIASGLMFFFPVLILDAQNSLFVQNFDSISISKIDNFVKGGYILAGLTALVSGLSLANIFFYRNRHLQMRICLFNSILVFFLLGFIAYFSFSSVQTPVQTFALSSLLPIIVLIFTFIARYSIKKDEELIKSVERIR